MQPFVEHIERTLGEIVHGWNHDWPFYVLRFDGGPIEDCRTFVTLGLSDHVFTCAESKKEMRHELVIMAKSEWQDRNIPAILHQVGTELLATHHPLLRGHVIGPRGELFEDTQMRALYVTAPYCLPESFAVYKSDTGVVRFFIWLVPITENESLYIQQHGWREFECRLVEAGPDLLDFCRPSVL